MKVAGIAGLIELFAELPAPRVEGGANGDDVLDILVLALCAAMWGAKGLTTSRIGSVSRKTGFDNTR